MSKALPYEHIRGSDYWNAKDIPNLLTAEGKNPLYNKENSIWMPWRLCEMDCKKRGIKYCSATCGNRINFKNKDLRPKGVPQFAKIKRNSYLVAWDQKGKRNYN